MSTPETAKKARITDTPSTHHGITRRDFLYFTSIGAAMAALAGPLSAFAESTDDEVQGQSADTPSSEFWGHFYYDEEHKSTATIVDGQIQEDFYFNENFFANSAFYFNPHLCSLACSLALASFPSNSESYADKSSNAAKLFEALDCNAAVFVANEDYKKEPETDTIGLVCSHRTITVDDEDCNLIFLGIRGAVYKLEWCSNLKAGPANTEPNGNHQGFTEAANKAIAFLKAYIERFNLTGRTKILAAGFSRAAVTTNLTAGYIIDQAIDAGAEEDEDMGFDLSSVLGDQLDIYQGDLYAYCFESPAGTLADSEDKRASALDDHRNIFNIINPCDLVPLVMPSQFQFLRYGVDVKLPGPTDGARWVAAKLKMIACATKVGEQFDPDLVDTFSNVSFFTRWIAVIDSPKHPNPQNLFLVEFFDALTSSSYINSRTKYYTNFQETFRTAYYLNNEMSSAKGYSTFFSKLGGEAQSWVALLYACIKASKWEELRDNLDGIVRDALRETDSEVEGATLYNTYFERWKSLIHALITEESTAFLKEHFIKVVILATKGSDIFTCHKPGMALAWVHAMDSNFITGTTPFRPSGIPYAPEPDATALAEYGGSTGEDEAVYDTDTRYRVMVFTGTDLNIWTTVDGKEYQLFEDGKLVEYEEGSVNFPFVYNIDFNLQKSVWLDAATEQKFRVVTPEGTDFRCIERRLDTTKNEPTAVYVFDNMPDVFPESVTYEITAYEDYLYVYEPYGEEQFNATSIKGNYYHEGDEGSDDKTMYYTINASTEPAEAAGLCGGGYSKRGERTLLLAFTEPEYELDYWTLDGKRVTSEDGYTEVSTYTDKDGTAISVPLYQVLVDADHDVVAHFKKKGGDGGSDGGDGSDDKGDGEDGSGDGSGDGNSDGNSAKRTSDDPMPQTGDDLDAAAKLAAGAAALASAAAVATRVAGSENATKE